MRWSNGDEYVGEFKEGQAHGKGILTNVDGTKYSGGFFNGTLSNEGIIITNDRYHMPFWYTNPPVDVNYLYAAASENSASEDGAINLAKKSATRQLNNSLGARFHELASTFLSQTKKSNDTQVMQEVRNIAHGIASGVASGLSQERNISIEKTTTFKEGNGYRAFVLIKYPVSEADKNLVNILLGNRLLLPNISDSKNFSDLKNKVVQDSEARTVFFEQEKLKHRQAEASQRINLKVTVTAPSTDGEYIIYVETNADTASLKINGEELGGKADGRYKVNRVAYAGQDTKIDIVAKDVYGNLDTKTIMVNRAIVESKVAYAELNPAHVKRQTERDAVAIVIGISNYKTLPKAEFANNDARVFYDYAIRALGVKAENIKLLVDGDAEELEIIKAFKTWLPSRVKSTTDVYVYYSGHGLPTQDGKGLYLLPPRADRDFISRTSIQFQEINSDLQAAKPKSVTIFIDACYSGQTRSGETLVANARPVALKAEKKLFPDNFTIITASQADQISSSSPDLKHGVFSYYLMKGMEGDADADKDGKITLGEMQVYLVDNVGRQAGMMSRKQEPQFIGEVNRVLVGR